MKVRKEKLETAKERWFSIS